MAYDIEIISVGDDSNAKIGEIAHILNVAQDEFRFHLPPERLKHEGTVFVREEYENTTVFEFLKDYRVQARGYRPFLIAVINGKLRSESLLNLFGSHKASEGVAVITLHDHQHYADSYRAYLCYYFIRYALSFACPDLKTHEETRNCFFDRKVRKLDLQQSLESGEFCSRCKQSLAAVFSPEVKEAVQKMITVMKGQHASSRAILDARSLAGQTDIGILTIRDDEFEAVLDHFPSRRRAAGRNRYYDYSRVLTRAGQELGVAMTASLAQGQGASSAAARDMIGDFAPHWIFLVGIAGGFADSEYSLGDVLLSSRVHDFTVSAALEGGMEQFQQQGGPVHVDVERILMHLPAMREDLGDWSNPEFLRSGKPFEEVPEDKMDPKFYGSEEHRTRVHGVLRKHFAAGSVPRNPIWKAVPMITSDRLMKDTELALEWQKSARHAAAVEMELGGVYLAARYGGDGSTRVLAIRGISDIVGYKRRPEWTAFACRAAAGFTYALIKSGIIQRPGPFGSGGNA